MVGLQSQETIAIALLAGALSAAGACGARSTTLDGYPEEDDDGSTGTSTTSSSTTGTGATSSDTWTPTGEVTCDRISDDCATCQGCAFEGPCFAELSICTTNPECVPLIDCVSQCQDLCASDANPGACFEVCANGPGGCSEIHPAGIDDFNALVTCVIDTQCPSLCSFGPGGP